MRFDISLQNFKKPLVDISPQIERKNRSEENLGIILAVERKLVESSSLKTANTGKPAA